MSRQARKALAPATLVGAFAGPFVHSACVTDPEPRIGPEVAELQVLFGDQQIQGREARLNEPVMVLALDGSGDPVLGARVEFTPNAGTVRRSHPRSIPIASELRQPAGCWGALSDRKP